MFIKAKFPTEINGHICRKGEVMDYNGVISQRIVDNFTDENGCAIAVSGSKEIDEADNTAASADAERKSKINKTIEVMKREGIKQALDGMGITYSPKSKTEYLAKLLLLTKGEIEEE